MFPLHHLVNAAGLFHGLVLFGLRLSECRAGGDTVVAGVPERLGSDACFELTDLTSWFS